MKENTVDSTIKNRIILVAGLLSIAGIIVFFAYQWSIVSSDENQKLLNICLEGIGKINVDGIENPVIEHEVANMLQNKCFIP